MPKNPPDTNPHELSNMASKLVSVRVDGINIKGMLLVDDGVRVVVVGDDGNPVVIVKNKIAMYRQEGTLQPLQVLACANPLIRCSGVRYINTKNDGNYDIFMNECPFKCDTCKRGNLGEWGALPRKLVAEIIGDMILGDYPEKISKPTKTLPKEGENE